MLFNAILLINSGEKMSTDSASCFNKIFFLFLLLQTLFTFMCIQITHLFTDYLSSNFYLQKIYKKQDYKKACIYRIDFGESEGSQWQKSDRGSSTVVQ